MKKKYFFCLFSSFLILPIIFCQTAKVKSPYEYELMHGLSDEFNGTILNNSKWHDFDPFGSRDIGLDGGTYANPACVKFEQGSDGINVLKLIAKKGVITGNSGWTNNQINFFYQTGMLVSKTFFYHGYYEIRAKMPKSDNSNGMAFWFWDKENNTVYSELDVFETQPVFNYRYPTATHYSTDPNSAYQYNIQDCDNVPLDITNGWHTYGVDWAPDAITFYIDGIIVEKHEMLKKFDNTGEIGVNALRKMRLILANSANFGIEASTTGDVMELDYFRYYKRKPSLYFSSYNPNTGEYTYAAKSNTPSDIITWSFDVSKIIDVSIYTMNDVQFIRFKRVLPTGSIILTAKATQTLQLQDPVTTKIVSTQSSISVGTDNAYFYTGDTYFSGGKNSVKAYAASPSLNSEWSIGLKNIDGTIDWSIPQTQFGTSVTFNNLLSGKTYIIKHGVYGGNYLSWNEISKEITVSFNSEFYVDKIQSISPNSNTVQMLLHQVSSNPDSEWHIWLLNSDGSYNTSIDQPQWGQTATFNNLIPGKSYQVIHGNYGANQAWVSSSKLIPVDLESNFEFYNPNAWGCMGPSPKICYENGAYKLYVHSRDYNSSSPLINGYASEFALYELDANGNHFDTDPLAAPILYSKNGKFTVSLNKKYLVKHGVSSPNGYWTETRKTVRTLLAYVDCTKSMEVDEENNQQVIEDSLDLQVDELNDIQIFPNPTSGLLNIRQYGNIYQTASILDPIGRILMKNILIEKGSIDISQLPSGSYILNLESVENSIKVVNVIKQ